MSMVDPESRGLPLAMRHVSRNDFSPLSIASFTGDYDFSDLSTLFQDTGRATPVTADAQLIGSVTDKSGGGRHLTRGGIAGTEPTWKAALQNGLGGARFNAAHWLLSGATFGADTAQTVIMVANYPGTVAQYGPWSRSASTNNRLQFEWNNGAASLAGMLVGTGAATYTEAWTAGLTAGWHIITCVVDNTGAVSQVYGDGVLKSSATGVPSIICDTKVAIGSRATNALSSALVGDIGRVLTFSAALGSVDRLASEQFLRNRWGTP